MPRTSHPKRSDGTNNRLTTDQVANRFGVKSQTIHAALCREGHYFTLKPEKAPLFGRKGTRPFLKEGERRGGFFHLGYLKQEKGDPPPL